LLDLMDNERPKVVEAVVHWAASNGDRSENGDYIYGKKRLREIDRRIRFLTKRWRLPKSRTRAVHFGNDQVFFGATVFMLEGEAGQERTVTIPGIDEADSAQGEVSWVSPIARTLLKARTGDVLKLVTPGRVEEIEVLRGQLPRTDDQLCRLQDTVARSARITGAVRRSDCVAPPSRWLHGRAPQ
jgi:transcription elongation factor GreB